MAVDGQMKRWFLSACSSSSHSFSKICSGICPVLQCSLKMGCQGHRIRFMKRWLTCLWHSSAKRKGDIVSKMTSDVAEVESSVMSSVEVVFKEPFTIIFFLGTLMLWSPELTVFVLILLPLTGLIIGRIGKSPALKQACSGADGCCYPR